MQELLWVLIAWATNCFRPLLHVLESETYCRERKGRKFPRPCSSPNFSTETSTISQFDKSHFTLLTKTEFGDVIKFWFYIQKVFLQQVDWTKYHGSSIAILFSTIQINCHSKLIIDFKIAPKRKLRGLDNYLSLQLDSRFEQIKPSFLRVFPFSSAHQSIVACWYSLWGGFTFAYQLI